MEYVKCIADIMGGLANFIIAIAAVFTLSIARRQLMDLRQEQEENHESEKRRATVEFYYKMSEEINFELDLLEDEENRTGTSLTLSRIKGSRELGENVVILFSRLQWLATGIALGAYDFETLNLIGGRYIIRKYNQLEEYINNEIDEYTEKHPGEKIEWYAEVVALVETRKEYEKNHPKRRQAIIDSIRAKSQ